MRRAHNPYPTPYVFLGFGSATDDQDKRKHKFGREARVHFALGIHTLRRRFNGFWIRPHNHEGITGLNDTIERVTI